MRKEKDREGNLKNKNRKKGRRKKITYEDKEEKMEEEEVQC